MRKLLVTSLAAVAVFTLGYCGASVAERGNDPMVCAFGYEEDDCAPDFIGDGEWTLRPGNP